MQLKNIFWKDVTFDVLATVEEKIRALCGTAYKQGVENSTDELSFSDDGTVVLHDMDEGKKYTREEIETGDICRYSGGDSFATELDAALNFIATEIECNYYSDIRSARNKDTSFNDRLLIDDLMHDASQVVLRDGDRKKVRAMLEGITL